LCGAFRRQEPPQWHCRPPFQDRTGTAAPLLRAGRST
jgi:hypothetical protein